MDPARLKRLHAALPPGLRAALPHRLEARARAWLQARRAPGGVAGLEDRLWGGFSEAARRDLAMLSEGPGPEAAAAALVLARWQAAHGDFAGAAALIAPHPPANPTGRRLASLFLACSGRGTEARALLLPRSRRFEASAALIRATSWRPAAGASDAPEAETMALAEINSVFAHFGLQTLAKRDPARPLSLDNLRGRDPGPKPGGTPGRVTVLVPAFEAEATLATALAGLCDQTHGDLEILVIDDASTDATAEVAADCARADPRIRLIRQPRNRGGYAARNRALAEAGGAFVTVHDADDWSHPEKIARQMAHLARTKATSNVSAWVRVTPDLGFLGPARVFPDLMGLNDSATLFRRADLDRCGPWDAARIGADKELIWRFERLAGRPHEAFRRRMILPGCPLTFGRLAPASLTRTGATHVLSVYHGIRREYREAADFWHRQPGLAEAARRGPDPEQGFFPAPPLLRPDRDPGTPRDLLVIGDFNFLGGTQKSALHMLGAARAAGRSAALLQYRRYDQDVTAPLPDPVRAFARDAGIRILAPGEALRARTVIVSYPPVFQEVMDRFPAVDHENLVVVVNQMAARDTAGTDIAYDPARVRANLVRLLGHEGHWAPISERVRALMAADPRYPAPLPDTWTPLVDTATWCAHAPVWRGDSRARPVLGRHGRDDPLKWPRQRDALRAAYCADRPCEVRFLGGSHHARAVAGRRPDNWRDLPFGSQDVQAFLADLDVFVHFPAADYIEEFGRAPMEAMAVGVPVILPPEFRPTFGEAALYAAPDAVWPLVARLRTDRAFWESRVAAGRDFVRSACDYGRMADRLDRLDRA